MKEEDPVRFEDLLNALDDIRKRRIYYRDLDTSGKIDFGIYPGHLHTYLEIRHPGFHWYGLEFMFNLSIHRNDDVKPCFEGDELDPGMEEFKKSSWVKYSSSIILLRGWYDKFQIQRDSNGRVLSRTKFKTGEVIKFSSPPLKLVEPKFNLVYPKTLVYPIYEDDLRRLEGLVDKNG